MQCGGGGHPPARARGLATASPTPSRRSSTPVISSTLTTVSCSRARSVSGVVGHVFRDLSLTLSAAVLRRCSGADAHSTPRAVGHRHDTKSTHRAPRDEGLRAHAEAHPGAAALSLVVAPLLAVSGVELYLYVGKRISTADRRGASSSDYQTPAGSALERRNASCAKSKTSFSRDGGSAIQTPHRFGARPIRDAVEVCDISVRLKSRGRAAGSEKSCPISRARCRSARDGHRVRELLQRT